MVTIKDDCCCEDKALKEQIKERALSSINKIYTTQDRTYYPDGTGMVTIPLTTQEQLDQIDQNAEDIATLKVAVEEGDAKLDAKIDAVDATLSEAIAANVADIAAVDKAVDELSDKVAATIPTEYRLYRTGEGKIQLQAETADGTLIDSNTLDMVIPYQYDLIAGSTDRSFKIRITLSNGTTYDTNDFIIPTPGDAPVEVTGIIMSKDPDNVNRFKVGVNLSDGSMIETGYVTFIDSVEATVAENKLTVAVNDVESVPTNVVTSVAADYADNVLTVAVNGVSDSVTIEGGETAADTSPFFVSILNKIVQVSNEDGSDIVIPTPETTTSLGHSPLTGIGSIVLKSASTGYISSSDYTIAYSITGLMASTDQNSPTYKITDETLISIIDKLLPSALTIRTSLPGGTLTFKGGFGFRKPNGTIRIPGNTDITYDIKTKKFSYPQNIAAYCGTSESYSGPYIEFLVLFNSRINYTQETLEYKISAS